MVETPLLQTGDLMTERPPHCRLVDDVVAVAAAVLVVEEEKTDPVPAAAVADVVAGDEGSVAVTAGCKIVGCKTDETRTDFDPQLLPGFADRAGNAGGCWARSSCRADHKLDTADLAVAVVAADDYLP